MKIINREFNGAGGISRQDGVGRGCFLLLYRDNLLLDTASRNQFVDEHGFISVRDDVPDRWLDFRQRVSTMDRSE